MEAKESNSNPQGRIILKDKSKSLVFTRDQVSKMSIHWWFGYKFVLI